MSEIPVEAGKPDDVRQALALLNAAGARIGNSLDLETTARELLDVAVPQFCDLAAFDLCLEVLIGDELVAAGPRGGSPSHTGRGSGELRRVAFASAVSDAPLSVTGRPEDANTPIPVGATHRYPSSSWCAVALDTGRVQASGSAHERADRPGGAPTPSTTAPTAPSGAHPVRAAPRTPAPRRPEPDTADRADPGPPPGADLDNEFGPLVHSVLAVPVIARGTVLGLVQFARTKGSQPFGERDAALAAELAARAAVCVDNARLYRREHERALILQRSLLPPGAPEAAGLDIACRYLPGTTATEVGGDWFDVIELPGHRTALVVGDVMGRGLRAAVAMGELRTAVRTLALLDLEPAEVLTALDEIARGLDTPTRSARGGAREGDLTEIYLATCVYAVYDPIVRRCTFANAGHVPPALVVPGESALMLELPSGLPLGVGGEPFEEIEVDLPDGALLALYTDGLVESRGQGLDDGLSAFRKALVTADAPLELVCDHVLGSLDTHHGEDDIALLMARVQGLPVESVGDWRLPAEPRSVARARDLTCEQLATWGLQDLADTAELLVSELVTNALRHGEGEIRLRLLRDRSLVCEVWDAGLVQPRRRRARETDEGGRGLQLVDLLSASWGSRRTTGGKIVWFELAMPDGRPKNPDDVEALLSLW